MFGIRGNAGTVGKECFDLRNRKAVLLTLRPVPSIPIEPADPQLHHFGIYTNVYTFVKTIMAWLLSLFVVTPEAQVESRNPKRGERPLRGRLPSELVFWKIRETKGGIWKFIFHRRRKRVSINLPRARVCHAHG